MKKRFRWGALLWILAILPFAFFIVKGVQILKALSGGGGIFDPLGGMSNPKGQFPGKDRVSILIIGKDYNRDSKGMPYTKNARADTIMLLGVDLDKKTISAVSIPRDTRVKAPDGGVGKINGTMARGGAQLVTQTITQMFDVSVDYTVVLKADAVKEIVNAVGGVDVETIDFMKYDDNWGGLHIDLPKGKLSLNGEEAVGYVRFREVNTYRLDERGRRVAVRPVVHSLEEGDKRRTERQQNLIRALVGAAFKPQNILKADQVIDVGFQQVDTNLKRSQLLALAVIMRGAGLGSMKTATLPGGPQRISGIDYFVHDADLSQSIVDWFLKGDEKAANRAVRVAVYNGSGVGGVARGLADTLSKQGYTAKSGGNTPKPSKATTIYFAKAAFFDRAESIAEMMGGAEIKKFSPAEKPEGLIPLSDLLIVIGSDSAERIRARVSDPSQTQSPGQSGSQS